ncbi:uncharacterized protein PODANS_5_1538 [Podospora anserina S mat+]|uniref:Podospora anserina S mat+ genomic DNA chromosome 5, supercontig 1 n=1 Tax=Podospora anserina (strain S / ATCC MYA-4624 / DSM 980 / FGSC 10383) TaxID=515849 RepID=B2AET9_PODAN|nr:uncharacterized protein PODANS_5_1538 [Podospora anserina S mat+]CAP61955.1 unnamed protein product [Podospora anserina S mat+]CDP29031.1 Putative protein of unknown function [Podospora anserina S mat+]
MAKNLLYQLCIKDDRLMEYVDAVMSEEGQAVLQRPELANKLVTTAMKNQEKLFVIIDGVDECLKPEKKKIIQWIQSMVAAGPDTSDDDDDMTQPDSTGTLRLLLVSQEDAECTRLLKGYLLGWRPRKVTGCENEAKMAKKCKKIQPQEQTGVGLGKPGPFGAPQYPTLKISPEDNHDDIKAFCEYWKPKIRAKHPKLQVGDGPASTTSNVLARADAFRLREELEWLRQDSGKLGVVGKLS